MLDLGKEIHAGAVEHPWESILEVPDAAGRVIAPGAGMRLLFDEANRALLILGEPGSGETITPRKVGGGYIFIHRLMMEYFAELAKP